MANNEPKKGGILRAYLNFNVLYKILIGLVIGAVAGIILAATGVTALPKWISMFGTIFTRLLKMIIIPMIVGSLVVGASSVSPANVGKVGIRVVIIYLVTSAFGVIIGLLMGNIFRPHAEMAAVAQLAADAAGKTAETNVWDVIANIIPTSVLQSLVNETVLQVIFFSLVFGLCLSFMKVSQDERIRTISTTMYNIFDCLAEIMMKIVSGIMQYAPILLQGGPDALHHRFRHPFLQRHPAHHLRGGGEPGRRQGSLCLLPASGRHHQHGRHGHLSGRLRLLPGHVHAGPGPVLR